MVTAFILLSRFTGFCQPQGWNVYDCFYLAMFGLNCHRCPFLDMTWADIAITRGRRFGKDQADERKHLKVPT